VKCVLDRGAPEQSEEVSGGRRVGKGGGIVVEYCDERIHHDELF
jgi:hypothetical protein